VIPVRVNGADVAINSDIRRSPLVFQMSTPTPAAQAVVANLAQVVQTVPNVLQTLAGDPDDPTLSDIFNVTASGTYVASGVLFVLGPLLTGPINAVLPPTALGLAASH
jgi:hypothetical protein